MDKDFKLFETALEIRYSSLKLDKLPIKFSTFKTIVQKELIKVFGLTDLNINKIILKECASKIIKINNKNFIEFKNREFKAGFEIEIQNNGNFMLIPNNYYYEIYLKNNLKRFQANVSTLKNIFTGYPINMSGKYLKGQIRFENRIEIMKFELLEKEILNLQQIHKEKLIQNSNSLYSLALLNLLEKNHIIKSWINFKYNLEKNLIEEGDEIFLERVHMIEGNDFDIKETIKITQTINKNDIKGFQIISYRKPCEITLEKIQKNSLRGV